MGRFTELRRWGAGETVLLSTVFVPSWYFYFWVSGSFLSVIDARGK